MSEVKHPLTRFRILDRCLNDRQWRYNIDDLLEACNDKLELLCIVPVSKRQIYSDLEYMKSDKGFKAPIKSYQYGTRKYLRYSHDFSIMATPISETELSQLQVAVSSLQKYRGLPFYDWIDELLTKLQFRLGIRHDDQNIIGFEQNKEMIGLRFLSDIINYSLKHMAISVVYKPYNKDEMVWTIHPYYLKQYNNRWFLLGWNEMYDDLSIVPLDRIQLVEQSDKKFRPNRNVDFDQYFNNIIGVSIEEKAVPTEIVLQFSKDRLPYVLSKPLHHSQSLVDEEKAIVAIKVVPNKELLSQILWFGDDVEIISPGAIREQISKKIELMSKKYLDVKQDCTTSC